MIDLTPIVEAIVALVAAIITAFVIPWLKGKIDADKLEEIELWVTVAVEAAEQLYVGSGRGAEKKAYVVQFLQEKGFTLDPDSLDKLIEAAVFNLPEYIGMIEAGAVNRIQTNTDSAARVLPPFRDAAFGRAGASPPI